MAKVLSDTVLLEAEWVLRAVYKRTSKQIIFAFHKVAGLANVEAESFVELENALTWYEQGIDFADAFHVARSQHVRKMVTFDRRFVKRASHIASSCQVVELSEEYYE